MQPVASETTGKDQKYERTGPQEFVPFPYDEITIQNIKEACNKYFKNRFKTMGKCADVLAGERGPSCSRVDQLPNFKVIHVRFIHNNICGTLSQSVMTISAIHKSFWRSSVERSDVNRLNPIQLFNVITRT